MKRAVTLACAVSVAALALCFTGCTLHITMNPSSATDMEYGRIQGQIILVMDSEFTKYHWEGFSVGELRGLDYDLGGASKNLFSDAFRRTSASVSVVETRPAFPITGSEGIILVVQPRIGGFSEKNNPFIRNANYYVTITYHVIVCDKIGKVLLQKDYTETGVEMGTIDLYRNYAAPAETAMARAVRAMIADIGKLASVPKAP